MPTIFRPLRTLAPALFGVMGAACVTYPVTPVDELTPGHTVVLTLSDSAIPAMAPRLGPGVFRVQGKLQQIDSLALVVDVSHTASTRNVDYRYVPNVQWNGDPVSIPRSGVANARQGHVSVLLTILGAAMIGGSAALMASLSHHPAAPKLPPPSFP